MWTSTYKISAAFLITTVAVAGGGLQAQQAQAPKSADSPEMAQTEAKLAKLREVIKPQPGEHVTNMAKIAWEHDPWEAAVKAGREGKPILAWGECGAGVPCGYG